MIDAASQGGRARAAMAAQREEERAMNEMAFEINAAKRQPLRGLPR
jgi:hypothetical protein